MSKFLLDDVTFTLLTPLQSPLCTEQTLLNNCLRNQIVGTLGPNYLGLNPDALWPWINYIISLCLGFCICNSHWDEMSPLLVHNKYHISICKIINFKSILHFSSLFPHFLSFNLMPITNTFVTLKYIRPPLHFLGLNSGSQLASYTWTSPRIQVFLGITSQLVGKILGGNLEDFHRTRTRRSKWRLAWL